MPEPVKVRHNGIAGRHDGWVLPEIALGFWRTAEKLRSEAEKETAGQSWRTHTSIHSAICLYHAALECFINEEITFFTARLPTGQEKKLTEAYRIQGETLSAKKLDAFWSFFGLSAEVTPDVTSRATILANLRKRLYHHWPVLGDVRDYPTDVIAALNDAKIERMNASWAAQCGDVRLAEWAAKVVRGFVDEWANSEEPRTRLSAFTGLRSTCAILQKNSRLAAKVLAVSTAPY